MTTLWVICIIFSTFIPHTYSSHEESEMSVIVSRLQISWQLCWCDSPYQTVSRCNRSLLKLTEVYVQHCGVGALHNHQFTWWTTQHFVKIRHSVVDYRTYKLAVFLKTHTHTALVQWTSWTRDRPELIFTNSAETEIGAERSNSVIQKRNWGQIWHLILAETEKQ